MTGKERLYAVLSGQPFDRIPITPIFMAWAAHYIGKTYRDYYLNGQVLAEAQLKVADDFGFDQVSAISDPWRESSAYGMEFEYPEDSVGIPKAHLITGLKDIEQLRLIDPFSDARLRDRLEAIKIMFDQSAGRYSVLGWIEGPLAQYSDLRGLQNALVDLIETPEWFEKASERMVENAKRFARAQIECGADMIGVGDAAASLIGPELYDKYVFPWHKQLFASIHQMGAKVKLHICGNITPLLALLVNTGADIIDIDWMVDLDMAVKCALNKTILCGNIDPSAVMLYGSPQDVELAATRFIRSAGPRCILMPGCEIPSGTSEQNIRALKRIWGL